MIETDAMGSAELSADRSSGATLSPCCRLDCAVGAGRLFFQKISAVSRRAGFAALLAVAACWVPKAAKAQTLNWDRNSNQTDGSGNWDTTSPLWYTGSSDTVWTNGETAVFGYVGGTGGTLTLTGPISASGLKFNTDPGSFIFAGAGSPTLTLGSGGINIVAATGSETFNSTLGLTLGGSQTWTNNSTTGTLTIGGGIFSSGTQTLTIGGAGKTSIGGIIADGAAAEPLSLTLASTGVVTLSGLNTYSGLTTLNSGSTLTLDFTALSSSASNIMSASSGLVLNGGALNVIGKSGVSDIQQVNGVTVNAGASAINLTGASSSSVLFGSLGNISRNVGGTLNIKLTNSTTTTTTSDDAGGLLGAGITLNGTDWATNNAFGGTGTGNIVVATYTPANSVGGWASGKNINNTAGYSGTLGANLPINSLRFNSAASSTVGLGTFTLTDNDGILLTPTVTSLQTISGGIGGTIQGASGKDLVIVNNAGAGGSLTISSAVSTGSGTIGLTVSGLGSTNISGLINGSGGVIQNGGGNLTLSGANGFTGGTTLGAGTITLSGSGTLGNPAGALTVNGGVLNLGGTNQTIGNFTGVGGTILNNATGTNATLSIGTGNGTGGNFSGIIANNSSGTGTVALTKLGSGSITLSGTNIYTGLTSVNGGTLITDTAGINGSSTTNGIAFGGGTLMANSAAGISTNKAITASGTILLDSTNGPISLGGGIASTTSGLTLSGNNTLTLSGTENYSGATTINSGQLLLNSSSSLSNTAISVASAATLAVAPGAGTVNAGSTGGGTSGASLNLASGANFTMQDGNVGTFNLQHQASFSGTSLTLGGANLAFDLNSASADALTAQGLASVTGSNTINLATATGVTSLSLTPRTLISATSGLATIGQFKFSNGVNTEQYQVGNNNYTLTLAASGTALTLGVAGGNDFWIGGAASDVSGWSPASTVNWSTASGGARNIAFNNGDALTFDDNASAFTVNVNTASNVAPSAMIFNNAAHTYTIADTSTGVIAGAGQLVVQGGGTVNISGQNTFSGGTSIVNGTLALNSSTTGAVTNGPVGTGAIALGSPTSTTPAALYLGTAASSGGVAVANPINVQSTQSNALLTIGGQNTGGTNTYGGLITLDQGITINEPNGGSLNFTGGITSGSAGTQAVNFANAGTVLVNSAIGGGPGVLNVVQTGGGTTTFAATNSYTGGTAIQNGTIQIGTSNALPTSAGTITFGLGATHGTLDLNGNNQAVSGLAIGSGATAANQIITNTNSAPAVLTYNGGVNSAFGGTLQDGGSTQALGLTVAGGTLALNGMSEYTGATAVVGGTLSLSNGGAGPTLGNTAVTVGNSGGTVLGTLAVAATAGGATAIGSSAAGTTGATLTINSNSTLTMQDGVLGTFNLQQNAGFSGMALTLNSAALAFDVGNGASDQILLNRGKILATGTNTIALNATSSLSQGLFPLITTSNTSNSFAPAAGAFVFAGNGQTTESLIAGGRNYQLSLLANAGPNPGEYLQIGGGADFWIGPGNSLAWDGAAQNWSNVSGGSPSGSANTIFSNGDSVVFDDHSVSAGPVQISVQAPVNPAAILFNNATKSYVLSNSGGAIGDMTGGQTTLSVAGGGAVTISGANTFSGGTAVSKGTLVLASSTSGTGPIVSGPIGVGNLSVGSGGEVDLQGGISIANSLTSLSGTGVSNGAALYNSAGSNTYGGTITLGGAGSIGAAANSTLTLSGGVANGGNLLTFNGAGNINALTGAISGAGGLFMAGSSVSTLTLGGSETYFGDTTVSSGMLTIGATGSLVNSTNLNIAAGASFNLNSGGSISTSTALTNNGSAIFGNPALLIATLNGTNPAATMSVNALTVSGGGSFAGSLNNGSGVGSLAVSGGTLSLAGNNTYSGPTVIGSGATVALTNSTSNNSVANSPSIALASGATFDVTGLSGATFLLGNSGGQSLGGPSTGTGTVAGNLTISALGTIYGTSGGTLAIGGASGGTLDLLAGSSANFTLPITGPGGPLITANALILPTSAGPGGGNATVTIANGPALVSGTYDLIDTNTAVMNSNVVFSGSVPHNWSLSTGLNPKQLDLVVARSDSTLTATDLNNPIAGQGTQAVWSVLANGAGSSFADIASGAASIDPSTPLGAAGHGGPLLTNGDQPLMATILAGNNTGTYTGGAAATVTEQWRTRTLAESSLAEGGNPTSPPLPSGSSIVSNVLDLQGLGTVSSLNPRTGTNGIRTDPFVLSMDYDAQLLATESRGSRATTFLGWLNPAAASAAAPQWQNAVLGNFGGPGVDADSAEYLGSFAQFIDSYEFARDPTLFPEGTDPAALDNAQTMAILGSYGVDTLDSSVWAAIDHNSNVAVVASFQSLDPETVPEPNGMIPLAFTVSGLLLIRRRLA